MRRYVFLAILLIAVALFQAWFMGLNVGNFDAHRTRGTLTDLYVEGLAKGQSSLPVPVSDRSTWENQKYRLLDASYYQGRVYLYFGITPFALVAVPWHLLMGTFLSDGACILVFSQMGYLFLGCSLLYIFKDDRRPFLDWLFAAGVSVIVACSGTFSLMARPAIYEIEGACGYACLSGAIASLARAFCSKEQGKSFLIVSALFAGLTMGCRPNCFPAVVLIAAAIGYRSWNTEGSTREKTKALLICWAPLAIVGGFLAVWNYERFSNIFEFGYNYQDFAILNPNLVRFTPGNVFYNLHRFLLGGFRVGHYFPFIEGTREGLLSLPSQTHEPVTQLYGSLILFPVLIYACFASLERRSFGWFLLIVSAANLFYLLGLGFGTYRSPTDYLGVLSFVAAIGICNIPKISSRFIRRVAACLLVPILLWSSIACICQAASIARTTNLFDVKRPDDYSLLSSPFNSMAFRIESLAKSGPRAVRLTMMFPKGKVGRVEPIVVTGDAGLQDFIYVYYETPDAIEVGFESTGYGGPVSGPQKIDFDQPHSVDISLGSFLPPDRHPLLEALSKEDLSMARNLVHVAIDGRTVLESIVHIHPTRGRLLIGESPDDSAFGARFSGKLLKVERPLLSETGLYPKWEAPQFGPIALKMKMLPMPIGSRQPLVSVGYRPTGGVLFIENLANAMFRLGWQGYNEEAIYSSPFECAYQSPHEFEFYAGALLPPITSNMWPERITMSVRGEQKLLFRCFLDSREIWDLKRVTPDVSPLSIRVGENGLLETNIAEGLNGEVSSISRLQF